MLFKFKVIELMYDILARNTKRHITSQAAQRMVNATIDIHVYQYSAFQQGMMTCGDKTSSGLQASNLG